MDDNGKLRFRAAYDGVRGRLSQAFSSSRTKQSFKDECDVNVILRNYARTGVLPGDPSRAQYVDCTDVDFMRSMLIVTQAREAFAALPASVRDRFGNDPAQMLAFVGDKANLQEAIKLGLAKPSEAPAGDAAVSAAAVSGASTGA